MLEELNSKIQSLISLYENEKDRADGLERSLKALQAEAEDYRKKVADLTRQLDNLKLKGAITSGEAASPEAKQRLEKLIREIDKCISLLEK